MPSTINTSNIDTAYPIAGQDNDSQGFRDNFTNINTNFIAAKEEIEDLQGKVLLKSALIGETLDNDMEGALIKNAQVQGMRGTVLNKGTVNGANAVDVAVAPYQKMTTTGAISLSFLNFAAAGTHSVITLEIEIGSTADTVTLPAEVTLGVNGIKGYNAGVITFENIGTYILEFASTDAGATISIDDKTRARLSNQVIISSPPTGAIGSIGDKAGMIAYDSSYIYLCTADFDNVSNIWVRSSLTAW